MKAVSNLFIFGLAVFLFNSQIHKVNGVEGFNKMFELLTELNIYPPPNFDNLIELINAVSSQIDIVSNQISQSTKQLQEAISSLKNFISLEIEMNEVQRLKYLIQSRYRRMQMMSSNIKGYEQLTLVEFARTSVGSSSDSTDPILFSLFYTYFGYQKLNLTEIYERIPLIDKLVKEFQYEETNNFCPSISAQQFFYNEYLELILIEIRGYLINTFSWNVLRNFGFGAFLNEAYDSFAEHQRRSDYMKTKFSGIIKDASREIRKCDPDVHVLGTTYDQFTRISQGFIVNSANLDDNWNCWQPCSYFKKSTVCGCQNLFDPYCCIDQGFGNVFDCNSDTRQDIVNVCLSSNPFRRYEYFETNEGTSSQKIYGQKVTCNEDVARPNKRCNYCYCLLDEESVNSDRFFYLNPSLSDTISNKVITGIRFIKVNRVFHLQIQQATLAPFGQVDPTTVEWKPVDKYVLPTKVVNYKNVLKLNADVNNAIDLDTIHSDDPTFIVTGVRMAAVASSSGKRLKLQVQITKYDFTSGKLFGICGSQWISNGNVNKNFLPLNEPFVSTASPDKSELTTLYDAIQFTHSSKIQDAAQTTLPFFDIQGVESYSPVPLSGVGVYHKGFQNYGGFIAPRIFTHDYTTYI